MNLTNHWSKCESFSS